MKKCPKCHAEIQENARFCLYCMTSFEEKTPIEAEKENTKRWLYIIDAVLVFVLVGLSIFALTRKDNPSYTPSDTYTETETASTTDSDVSEEYSIPEELSGEWTENEQNTLSSGDNQVELNNQGGVSSNKTNVSSSNTNNNTNTGTNTTSSKATNSKATSSATATSSKATSSKATSSTTPSSSTNSVNSTVSTTSQGTTQPKYTYVTATISNAYPPEANASYEPQNAIVITKVNYKESSGNYVIPETIDGKKVAAIMPSAFSDSSISSSVKSVTLPSTVRTIWSNAFKNCYNLTDIYIKSTAIGIYTDAFPSASKRNGTLTIHCKRDCRNFNYYYYRNIAGDYDAEYAEWNG
ncbi:MAG: leucine-rich repeat protein [Clostridia bacterium]|nr:leucine-rich repeat protein [Clostridia bacterium]